MDNILDKVGMYCKKDKQLQVLHSAAGYYVGTFDEEGPYCRLTGYAQTKDDPILNIERECDENQFCNGGCIDGCKISHSLTRKHGIELLRGGMKNADT